MSQEPILLDVAAATSIHSEAAALTGFKDLLFGSVSLLVLQIQVLLKLIGTALRLLEWLARPLNTHSILSRYTCCQKFRSQYDILLTSGLQVRLQSQRDDAPLRYRGPLDCFRQTVAQDGIRGLYRGISSPLVGAAVENSALFFSVGGLFAPRGWLRHN